MSVMDITDATNVTGAPGGAEGFARVLRAVREAPAFGAARPTLEPLLESGRWPSLDTLSLVAGIRCEEDVAAHRRHGWRDRADLYDARITERGVLPTRSANWHDLFNVVTWAAFPRAKRALHARQHRRLCERVPARFERLPGARTDEQSALTQLDEGGVLIALPAHAAAHLEDLTEQLQQLAIGRVPLSAAHLAPFGASARIFGHALHEHLALDTVVPRAALLILVGDPAELDERLSAQLSDDTRAFQCSRASAWITPALNTAP